MDEQRTNKETTNRQSVNAALAARVQAGDKAALGELWQDNRAMLGQYFMKWYSVKENKKCADAHGVTLEDLEQEGYFATLYAAQRYDPAKGSFATWLMVYASKQIQKTLSNGHVRIVIEKDGSKHTKSADPLNRYTSLDMVLDESNDNSATLGDQQPDPSAEIPFQQVEDAIFTSELHAAIEEAFQKLTEGEAAAIRATFFENCTLQAAGDMMGTSASSIRQLQQSGIHKMRRNPAILRFHDEVIQSHAWHGTGFTSWKEHGSVQERTVEWLDEHFTQEEGKE